MMCQKKTLWKQALQHNSLLRAALPRGKIYCYLPNECYSDITTVGASLFINRCWAGHFSPFDTASLPQPFKETCDKKSFPLIILLANIQNCMGEFDITPRAISKSLKKYGNFNGICHERGRVGSRVSSPFFQKCFFAKTI